MVETNFINCSSLLANFEPDVEIGLPEITVWGDFVPRWTYLLIVSFTDPNSAPNSLRSNCLSLKNN